MLVHFVLKVALCFKKIAADILKIKLSRSEMDQSNNVIKAEIQTVPQPSTSPVKKKPRSSICSVQ